MKTNIIRNGNQDFPSINFKVFPEWASTYLEEVQKSLNCPPEYLPTILLSMVSTCIGSSTVLKVKNGWNERPAIYAIIVGKPSSKKSPALNIVMSPLEKIQRTLKRQNIQQIKKYQEELLEKGKNKEDKKGLIKPKEKVVFLTDTTMEALIDVLNQNPLGVMIKKDEINHFFMGLNAYKSGGGDLETVLELYNQQSASVARRGREFLLQASKPYLSIIGGIQFKPLKDFFINKENGITERFIFAIPKIETNPIHSWDEIDPKKQKIFEDKISKIFFESKEIIESKHEVECELSMEAKELWVEWQKLLPNKEEELDSMLEKTKAKVLRFALILHVLKYPDRQNLIIDEITMRDALLIGNFFVNCHIKLLYQFSFKETDDKVKHALNWTILQYRNNTRALKSFYNYTGVTVRDFQNSNNSKYKTSEEVYNIFAEMVTRGYGKFSEKPNSANKNIPTLFCLFGSILKEHNL